MNFSLTEAQLARAGAFRRFVAGHIEPFADGWDDGQQIPDHVIRQVAEAGLLGGMLPVCFGGQGWDVVSFGLLNDAFGSASSSLTDLLTVQAMVSMTLLKWGTPEQKSQWLPHLARGERIGAYALTEPSGGSDLKSLRTELRHKRSEQFVLTGTKRWISFGQSASLFLVFGQLEGKPTACLVPREAPGLHVEPILGMMGFRSAGLAQIQFDDVVVPAAGLVGKPGFALSHVAPVGLHYGRISTACSALGLLRGCLQASCQHAAQRRIGPQAVGDLGMIQSLLAHMGTDLHAAKLICLDACRAADERLPEAFTRALMAKYFTSRAAVKGAADAVQIHGAAGCHEASPVARYYRDSKLMEIIEGTSQIHEAILGKEFLEGGPQALSWG